MTNPAEMIAVADTGVVKIMNMDITTRLINRSACFYRIKKIEEIWKKKSSFIVLV